MPSLHGAQAKPCRIPMSIGTWDSATTTVWTRMVAWPRLAIFFRLGFDHVPPIRTGAQTTGFNATLCDCVDGWSRGRDGYSCRTRTRVNRQQRRPWQSTLEAVRTKQSLRLVTRQRSLRHGPCCSRTGSTPGQRRLPVRRNRYQQVRWTRPARRHLATLPGVFLLEG